MTDPTRHAHRAPRPIPWVSRLSDSRARLGALAHAPRLDPRQGRPRHPAQAPPFRVVRWIRTLLLLLGLGECAATFLGQAAPPNPGEEVVVVYNRRQVPDSRLIADHYAERRHVPKRQVIGLDLPTTENMTRAQYLEDLERPLFDQLEARGLINFDQEVVGATAQRPGEVLRRPISAKVRYLVLIYGVPLRILRDPTLIEGDNGKLRAEFRRNEAAVDSELALLPRSRYHPQYTGPAPNPLFAATNSAVFNPTNGVLLVARLDGPTPAIARSLVDKAIQGETDGLWGRAYFDLRGLTNGPYAVGDAWLRTAAEMVQRQGFETVIDQRPETFSVGYPLAQVAMYAGWYDARASGPFTLPHVEFMPGAVAYHLHSYSASTLRSTTEAWVGPLLAKGATVTMGCVDEPYLEFTPQLGIFFARLLAGFSFGEAACAAQNALSWQVTVVGDPLYRPFGMKAKERHEDLVRRQSPLLPWSYLRIVNLNLVTGLPIPEAIGYLEAEPITRQSPILEQKLGDLYIMAGNIREGAAGYAKALTLKPSPQERIHLELGLAQMQVLLEHPDQALQTYQQFFKEHPDYPELLPIYRRALAVAADLKETALAQTYEQAIARLTPASPATGP